MEFTNIIATIRAVSRVALPLMVTAVHTTLRRSIDTELVTTSVDGVVQQVVGVGVLVVLVESTKNNF